MAGSKEEMLRWVGVLSLNEFGPKVHEIRKINRIFDRWYLLWKLVDETHLYLSLIYTLVACIKILH